MKYNKQQKYNHYWHKLSKLPNDLIDLDFAEYQKAIKLLYKWFMEVYNSIPQNEYQAKDRENLIYCLQHKINYGY